MTRLDELNNAVLEPAEFQAPGGQLAQQRFKLTGGHWLLLGLGAICLLFIAFITLARSIQVTAVTPDLSNPEQLLSQPAAFEVRSLIKLPIGNRVMVLPGAHRVHVQAEGFEPLEQVVEVRGDRYQQVEVVLQRLPGILDIRIQPDIAANAMLNDEPIGQLPGKIDPVPAGNHRITIDAPLYRAVSQQLLVEGKRQTQSLSFTLEPAWADVSISSVPAGATVLMDNQEAGVTPLTLKVEEGSRKLEVRAERFKPFSSEFSVTAQQNLAIPEIELRPADGILEIQTEPKAAAVIVNGEFRGITPMTLNLVPDQQQELQVYKAGYQRVNTDIELAPDQRQQQSLTLQPDLVPVRFSVSPGDAEIYVDGVRRGQGSQTLSLNTLPHRISVRKPGYVSYQIQLIPTRANRQVVSAQLLTEEEYFWANLPDNYVTKAGQTMKLFKSPGQVRMGSSRREDGRRSNEVAYTAELNRHFYVSLHEVTNKQFRAYKATHNAGNYKKKSLDSNKHPAVNVSWQQAALYCNWLSRQEGRTPFYQTKSGFVSGQNPDADGYRLLTEVEWAWLARNKGDSVLMYPWGNAVKPDTVIGNYADVNAADLVAFTLDGYDDDYKASSPVGRFPANHSGLFDIDGNASEWVNDWYSAKGNLETDGPLVNPLGPDIGEFHVIRGASWAKGYLPQLRLAYRDYGAKGKHDVGFRIARYAGPPQ